MVVRGDMTGKKSSTLKPSRFNILSDDGEICKLYNSYNGDITIFPKDEAIIVKNILKSKIINMPQKSSDMVSKIITFLYQKGFLVNEDLNELQLATAQKYKMLSESRGLHLILMPNEDCNFRCVYCYEDFLKSEMKTTVQEGILHFLEKSLSKYNYLNISWFGGEPLKSFDIIKKMSTQMIEICKKNNVQYRAGITTNGYLLNKEIFTQLLDMQVKSFQITLDGTAQTHDNYRVGRYGEKTFDTILTNLIDMKHSSKTFTIVIRSNIDHEVAATMDEYISLVTGLFAEDSRFVLHFIPIQNLKGEQTSNVHLCDTKDLFPLYNKAKDKGFNFNFYKQYLQPGGSECYASKPSSYIIGSDGMIYKCTVAFNNPYNHVGKLTEDGELVIDWEKWSLWVTGGVNEDLACTKCYFRPSCQGNACPLERIESGATPCPPIKKNIKKYINLVDGDLVYG
ncbi:SPASM domain-containing protein [Paenibacillus thiaminolyticus]|nr:SPASM domain-containing protein [Paenibacillus thiaminolyticus]